MDTTTTTQDTDSKLTAAMRELSQLVDEFARNGKQANAAGLKPQLQFRSFNAFSESALGFPNFRAFLRAAEERGFIRLRPAVGGDLQALPAEGAEDPSAHVSQSATEPKRVLPVRPELWKAFFNWRPGFKRLYKVSSGDVYMFPEVPSPIGETLLYATFRAEWKASPALFLEIEPITQEVQLRWMREFTEQLPAGDAKQALSAALATTHPGSFFTRLVAALPDAPAWKQFRLERVVGEIQTWADQHHVTIDVFGRPPTTVAVPATPDTTPSAPPIDKVRTEELRRQILRAVERMSVSDLLRIPIPAEYWYE
jgi:hypothetical protein